MHNGRNNNQPLNNKNPAKVETGDHGPKIGQYLNNACQRNIELYGPVGVHRAISRDEVTQTDYRPDTAHEDHTDPDGVEFE